MNQEIEKTSGYKKLLQNVRRDELHDPKPTLYREKLLWIIDRAKIYSKETGVCAGHILDAWEEKRGYWYMNYYQECNQPNIKNVRVFEGSQELRDAIPNTKFRCPMCGGVSTRPFSCDSGEKVGGEVCDWKSFGLFGCLGKGVTVFIKETSEIKTFFMPTDWEK